MDKIICNRCKKPIEEVAYSLISQAIILQKVFIQMPPLFQCKEHAENFSMTMSMHTDCWMATLKDFGVPIHNMKEVLKKYLEEETKNGLVKNRSNG